MSAFATDTRAVTIDAAGVTLDGDLTLPPGATALVVFAHGSGSSRFSSRNRYVAGMLQQGGLGTLLFDLLTGNEHEQDQVTAGLRFDIPLLACRLTATVDRLHDLPEIRDVTLGLFGASTGAAAALISAAQRPDEVAAVVSRGGRPDLAMDFLPDVRAPTLLIVGGLDGPVIEMNREAAACLRCEHEMRIVPGATHLFEEPGKLEIVAELARHWFVSRLT